MATLLSRDPGDVPWEAPLATPPPGEGQELALRQLLAPDGLKITAEPLRRLEDRAVIAYELRWRLPRLDALPSRDDIWAAADAYGVAEAMDDALIRAQLGVAGRLAPAGVLINLTARRRSRPGLGALLGRHLQAHAILRSSVVWQLSEQDEFEVAAPTAELALDLRLRGYRVSLAEVGEGRMRISVLARVHPDLVHVDRSLVEGVEHDPGLAAALRGLLEFCNGTGAILVAGGVSTRGELDRLLDLGVEYGHGPLFGAVPVVAGPGAQELLLPKEVLGLEEAVASGPRLRVAVSEPASDGPAPELPLAEALGHAARSFQGEQDPQQVLETAADQLERLVPSDGLAMYQADWDALRFRPLLARSGAEPSYVAGVMGHSFPLSAGITGWAFDLGTPQLINDADSHPAAGHVPGTSPDDESMLVIPMVAGDHRLGVVNVTRFRRDAFSARELTMATLIVHMAAAAWRNAQLYSEQVQHAITDPLTGLLNTRWLRDAGRRELALAERSGRQLMLLMIDLDKFKNLNDSCGHAAGDTVLRAVALELQRAIRAEDAAVRYGGEEFVLLLHDAGPEGARRVARQLRTRLARIPLPPGSAIPKVTASVGIAAFPDHGRTVTKLLQEADSAMYAAKRRGGNRAVRA
ncbi:MAG: diguanylate cyclase [Candidatus Dormibacteraeota bacterium]|nr:diguanylate cyclase [Candidatus Dormibacteraeota bacterium]